MMAESTNLVDGGLADNNLSISWVDRYEFTNIPHTCMYSLDDSKLIRNYDGITTTVARNITHLEFSRNNNVLEVLIHCKPQTWKSKTVEKTFCIYLRAADEVTVQ
ncbi:hypothetical protein ACFLYQ_04860 [Chloroflexota bacterium]